MNGSHWCNILFGELFFFHSGCSNDSRICDGASLSRSIFLALQWKDDKNTTIISIWQMTTNVNQNRSRKHHFFSVTFALSLCLRNNHLTESTTATFIFYYYYQWIRQMNCFHHLLTYSGCRNLKKINYC